MKKLIQRLRIFLGVSLLLVLLSVLFINYQMNKLIVLESSEMLFDIPTGSGLGSVLRDLEKISVLQTYPLVFQIYARLTSGEGHIKAGEYQIPTSLTHKELLALFRSGKVRQYTITFPEGIVCAEWLIKISEMEELKNDVIEPACENLMALLGKAGTHAEGQFYPDTYHFVKGSTGLDIMRRAHERMVSVLRQVWSERQENLPLSTAYEALILASIVEKETGVAADRPNIASVFVNRLNKGMKLQSDPTIIYGMDDFDGNIRRKHLRLKTPYNTYVIPGLPPSPISNPGIDSLKAIMNPPETEFLYFVAKGDGWSYFSRTLEEHNSAVHKYQRLNRVDNYRSTPDDTP